MKNNEYTERVLRLRSILEPDVEYFVEYDTDMGAWGVFCQADGYPGTEAAKDSFFGLQSDAEDICRMLANGEDPGAEA